jgi:hypothetical protein
MWGNIPKGRNSVFRSTVELAAKPGLHKANAAACAQNGNGDQMPLPADFLRLHPGTAGRRSTLCVGATHPSLGKEASDREALIQHNEAGVPDPKFA